MKNILASRLTGRVLSAAMGVGLLTVLIMGTAGTALADPPAGGTATATISSGAFNVVNGTAPTLTGSKQLDGKDATLDFTLPLVVTDNSGYNVGWSLSVIENQFATGSADTLHTLPALSLSAITDDACDTTNSPDCVVPGSHGHSSAISTVPIATPTWDSTLNSGNGAIKWTDGTASPTPFYTAPILNGEGIIDLTANFQQDLPVATTYQGTYNGSIIVTLVAGS